MSISKLLNVYRGYLFNTKKCSKILLHYTRSQYLNTDKVTSTDYFKSKEFLQKYSQLLTTIEKPVNLDSKDASIVYLNDLFKAFERSVKQNGIGSENFLVTWRKYLTKHNLSYNEINFLIKYINNHENFNKLTNYLEKNIEIFSEKELATVLKAYLNLKDAERSPDLEVKLKTGLQIEQNIQKCDLYDIRNVYMAYKLLKISHDLVRSTSKGVFEKLIKEPVIKKFSSELLNDNIYGKDLYLAYDFQLQNFLWTRIQLFDSYKRGFTLDEIITFFNAYLKDLNMLHDKNIPKVSFQIYKTNLLAKFYSVFNETLPWTEILSNELLHTQLKENFQHYQVDFVSKLHHVEHYFSIQALIRLFGRDVAKYTDLQKDSINQMIKYLEGKLQKASSLEAYEFYQHLHLYNYILSLVYLTQDQQKLINKATLLRSKMSDIYINSLLRNHDIPNDMEIVNEYISKLKTVNLYSIPMIRDTLVFTFYLIYNKSLSTGGDSKTLVELFITNVYALINRLSDNEMFVKNSLPDLLAKVYHVNNRAHLNVIYGEEYKLCEKLKELIQVNKIEYRNFSDYLHIALFCASNRTFLEKNFTFIYNDLFKKHNLMRNNLGRLLPVIVCIERYLNLELLSNSKNELLDLVAKFQTKLIAVLQHLHYDDITMSELYNIEQSVDALTKISCFLHDELANSPVDYSLYRTKLTECLTAINISDIIANERKVRAEESKSNKNKMKLSTRIAKLCTLITNTNCFLKNDLRALWRYLTGYAKVVHEKNKVLEYPSNENFIEILKLFKHFDVTKENYYLERIDEFMKIMKTFYKNNLNKRKLTVDAHLTLAEALISLNCYDCDLFDVITTTEFYQSIDNSKGHRRLAWIKQNLGVHNKSDIIVNEDFKQKLFITDQTNDCVHGALVHVVKNKDLIRINPVYEYGLTANYEVTLDDSRFVDSNSSTVKTRIPIIVIDHHMYHTNATHLSKRHYNILIENLLKLNYRVLVVPILKIEVNKSNYVIDRLEKLKNDILKK